MNALWSKIAKYLIKNTSYFRHQTPSVQVKLSQQKVVQRCMAVRNFTLSCSCSTKRIRGDSELMWLTISSDFYLDPNLLLTRNLLVLRFSEFHSDLLIDEWCWSGIKRLQCRHIIITSFHSFWLLNRLPSLIPSVPWDSRLLTSI